jgi:hypothetical protein
MGLEQNLQTFKAKLSGYNCQLIAVSKTYPAETVMEAFQAGQKVFGENKVQELVEKYEALPKDIQWHLIGHLQTNKVKYITPFVHLIHSVDSFKLLQEINKQGLKNGRVISCLLQIHICTEETKFGLTFEEAEEIFQSSLLKELKNIKIVGFMGMATNTEDLNLVRKEFKSLKEFLNKCKTVYHTGNIDLNELSMGMSGDFQIALEEGSTMIRVGSAIFGKRDYQK